MKMLGAANTVCNSYKLYSAHLLLSSGIFSKTFCFSKIIFQRLVVWFKHVHNQIVPRFTDNQEIRIHWLFVIV